MELKKLFTVVAAITLCLLLLPFVQLKGSKQPFDYRKVSNVEECKKFLEELGWESDETSAEVKSTVLPTEFDSVYSQYNALQLTQGTDLRKYAGKNVIVYTLPVLNYAGVSEPVFATVITCEGVVIGGDVHSTKMGGFMHALK